jgi:protein-S-isoprenylcysteine O-methyltransferase Ste14
MITSRPLWWKGTRGEWYVVVQVALFLLVAFGPQSMLGWFAWPLTYIGIGLISGGLMMAAGLLLIIAGIWWQGANIAAVPYPKDSAVLLEAGPYRVVRHPMYSGGVLMACGWAFFTQGWLTFIYAVILFVFFDFKARREELWLKDEFPGYIDYQKRVNKLIPFLY